MSELTISEHEAKSIVIALGTAMRENDKQTREQIYEGLNEESLKRIIRWSMRFQLRFFEQLCYTIGIPSDEAWNKVAMGIYLEDE